MPRSSNSKYFKKALLIAIPGTLIIGALVFAILLSSPNNEKNNADANNLTDKTVATTAKKPGSKKEKQAKSSAQTDNPPKEINADSGNNRQNSTQNGNASNQAASPTAPEVRSNNAQTKETEEGAEIENSTEDRDVAEDAQNTEPNGAKNTPEIERMKESARQYNAAISAGDPNKGGYPYSERCPEQIDAFADQWGMLICENVSYVAWKVYDTYGYMPYWGGRGNANQWPSNARAAGYTVSSTPKVGSVGISMGGAYGHAVWVEAVSSDRVHISQYNARNAATDYKKGEYSEQWVNQSMYQYYIYFSAIEMQDANE